MFGTIWVIIALAFAITAVGSIAIYQQKPSAASEPDDSSITDEASKYPILIASILGLGAAAYLVAAGSTWIQDWPVEAMFDKGHKQDRPGRYTFGVIFSCWPILIILVPGALSVYFWAVLRAVGARRSGSLQHVRP